MVGNSSQDPVFPEWQNTATYSALKAARSYQFFVLYYSRLAVLLNCISLCIAYKTYQSKIPNGDSVPNPCSDDTAAKWNGVGHIAMAGAGDRNIFGIAFKAAGAVSENGAQSVISQKIFYTPNSRKDNLLVDFWAWLPGGYWGKSYKSRPYAFGSSHPLQLLYCTCKHLIWSHSLYSVWGCRIQRYNKNQQLSRKLPWHGRPTFHLNIFTLGFSFQEAVYQGVS